MATRRLVLLFDSTWNKAESKIPNVEHLRQLIALRVSAGVEQLVNYIPGVGVASGWVHLLGGAFGYGLSESVLRGYRQLCRNVATPGDDVFLFGFSRGAYAARSLAGLVRKCGLLKADTDDRICKAAIASAYAFYRDTSIKPDDTAAKYFRKQHSVDIDIHFIGVWDHRSAPLRHSRYRFMVSVCARSRYQFHAAEGSARSSSMRTSCWHWISFHPAYFAPSVWTRNPFSVKPGETLTSKKLEQIEIEQRWFIGCVCRCWRRNDCDGARWTQT